MSLCSTYRRSQCLLLAILILNFVAPVRFQSFKKVIPRSEIETMWLLLAFSAEPTPIHSDGSKYRWRLIASLFGNDAGVLSKEYFESMNKDESKLPPAKDHVQLCQEELSRFGALLSSTALNPLPDSDTFLTKMFQKSLLLQSHAYQYSSDDDRRILFCDLDDADRTLITRTWRETGIHGDTVATALLEENCGNLWVKIEGRMTNLNSMSPLLQSCINLSMIWVQQVPSKKARQARLTQAFSKLIADCIDSAASLEAAGAGGGGGSGAASTFAEAFAAPVSNAGSLHAATSYREAASRLSMIGAVNGFDGARWSLTKELREKVSPAWSVIGC